ncbi:MAG: lipopolysaccharide heptosyltransferase II [Thermodesulfobacteriota bacterium]|nr:lipopolysaccharide heptosyltransferase II [Thermodesulfobacteriota bacterium]
MPVQLQPRKLLVYCPNWVGDVVAATPTFHCLRHNYPETEIIAVIRNYAKGVVEDGPWFDQILGCDDKTARGFVKLVKIIRDLNADIAIVLPSSLRSVLSAWFGGVQKIYGYRRNYRSFLLGGGPKPNYVENGILPVPMVEYYMEICRWFHLKTPDVMKPRLFMSDSLEKEGAQLIDSYGIRPDEMVIGINPGAKFGSSKCWPTEYFAKLAELFVQRWNCRILLLVGPGEDGIARSITASSKAPIINTGPDKVDLALLKYLVKRCQLLVTNDTGPRHYAVAFDIPVVVIMGPTDPRYTASNLEKTLVLRKELDCSPCHRKECHRDHECMLMIRPEAVFDGSKVLLERVM